MRLYGKLVIRAKLLDAPKRDHAHVANTNINIKKASNKQCFVFPHYKRI